MRNKRIRRVLRHKKITKKISGSDKVPRLVIFRSNKHIYAQLVDDSKGLTLVASSDLTSTKPKGSKSEAKLSKIEKSYEAGFNLAKRALAKKIKSVVFDRSGYKYHGRIKALAEGASKGGLTF